MEGILVCDIESSPHGVGCPLQAVRGWLRRMRGQSVCQKLGDHPAERDPLFIANTLDLFENEVVDVYGRSAQSASDARSMCTRCPFVLSSSSQRASAPFLQVTVRVVL